jgi:hypothetical protein
MLRVWEAHIEIKDHLLELQKQCQSGGLRLVALVVTDVG